VADEIGRRGVGREAVVLGHVPDELADDRALLLDVEIHHGRPSRGRLEQPQEDLEQRALARAVGADEADDPGLELEGQPVERHDAAWVSAGEVG
jgi:hypothetical protein